MCMMAMDVQSEEERYRAEVNGPGSVLRVSQAVPDGARILDGPAAPHVVRGAAEQMAFDAKMAALGFKPAKGDEGREAEGATAEKKKADKAARKEERRKTKRAEKERKKREAVKIQVRGPPQPPAAVGEKKEEG